MRRKYSHLFFDLDNTLWDFKKNSRCAMENTFGYFKLEKLTDFERFYQLYSKNNTALWESYRRKELGKKILIRRRFLDTFNELSISGIIPEEINEFYLDEMSKQKILMDGTLEILDYLKGRYYNLYIITNGFKEVQIRKLNNSGLMPYFNKIFISEEIRVPKPNRGIFEHAIRSANAKKSKSLMIGDDWEVDILGANNYGMDAIHFVNNRNLQCKKLMNSELNNNSYFQIGSMNQLSVLL